MLRIFFTAFLVLVAVLTAVDFFGIVPEGLGSVGRMNDLLGVLAIFFVAVSFGAMSWPAAVNRFFQRPLKREYRKLFTQIPQGSPRVDHTDFYRHLTEHICTLDEQSDTTPARLLAVARQQTGDISKWPWEFPELAAWAQGSEDRLRSNIVLRFLFSTRLETITQRLATMRGYAQRFPAQPPERVLPTRPEEGVKEPKRFSQYRASRDLADAIEAHTGASVLATGLHTRAGVDAVRLWHSDRVFSQAPRAGEGEADERNYSDTHFTTDNAGIQADTSKLHGCTWEAKLKESEFYLLGDRDNHVPIVDGVTLSENRWDGSIEFVLSTHSSCSAATDHSAHACKGLRPDLSVGTGPLWVEQGAVVQRSKDAGLLESNLAVHVAIVITDSDNERHLVLVRRGNTFRFGNQMLTVPGETLSLAAGGRRGYTDEHGAPDLLQHAMSGVRTALGLDLAPRQLRPSHVIMVNQRESRVSATGGRSQLVSTVGFTASLACSTQELETARAEASRASRHGVQGLQFVPLGNATDDKPEAAIGALLDELQTRRAEMDQMSTTAALVVAARLLGVEQVTAELTKRSGPTNAAAWWNTPWEGEPGSQSRASVELERSGIFRSPTLP